jgi:hypothetical protein
MVDLRNHTESDMENQDFLDSRDTTVESPQEMHERMIAEDAGEATIDLLEALREVQGGEMVTWKIWRVAGPNGEPLRSGPSEYCGEMGNSQLTMENLARLYGGGKYRVRGRFSNGKMAGGRTITIAGDVKRDESMATVAAGTSNGFNMSEFLALQAQLDAKREERADKRRSELLALAVPAIASIASALLGRPASATPDVAALVTALRPAVAPPDPTAQMKSMIETMLLMQKLNGGGDGDSLGSIIAAVAPHAGPVLTALASQPRTAPAHQRAQGPAPGAQPSVPPMQVRVQQAPPLASQPAAVVAPAPPVHTGVNLDAPSQPLSQEDRNMFAQLKPQVDTLVQMAREGADPVAAGQVFFDNVMMVVDDAIYDRLCTLIENPTAVDQLAIFNTGVKEQRAFFEAFQNKLKEMIMSQDQAAQNAG